MSDTIPTEPNASGVKLPSREQIRDDLEAVVCMTTAAGDSTLSGKGQRVDRILQVTRAYGRFALVSGREHGEAIEKIRHANERADRALMNGDKARHKAKRLKAALKVGRRNRDRLIVERDEARTALVEAMRIEEQRRQTLLQVKRVVEGPRDARGQDRAAILRILATEQIAEAMQVPKNLIENPSMTSITIVNPLQDATEAATRIVKSIQEISRPIGEAREVKPDAILKDGQIQVTPGGAFDRPTVGQSEPPTQIKTNRVEYLRRGDVIRFNHEDRTVTCIHHFGRDVQVCMEDTDDVSSQPFFKTDRETLVDVVGFGATTEPEIPDEPVAVSAGGWCAPSDRVEFWPFPEITVERGGISFTAPKPLTKKQLRAQNDRLVKGNQSLRKENRKLAKKVRRLSKAVKRLARA